MVTDSLRGHLEKKRQMIDHHGLKENDQNLERVEKILLSEFWIDVMERMDIKKVLIVNTIH